MLDQRENLERILKPDGAVLSTTDLTQEEYSLVKLSLEILCEWNISSDVKLTIHRMPSLFIILSLYLSEVYKKRI